jgi:hypothetical protein
LTLIVIRSEADDRDSERLSLVETQEFNSSKESMSVPITKSRKRPQMAVV